MNHLHNLKDVGQRNWAYFDGFDLSALLRPSGQLVPTVSHKLKTRLPSCALLQPRISEAEPVPVYVLPKRRCRLLVPADQIDRAADTLIDHGYIPVSA
jgi:hypothetical protein